MKKIAIVIAVMAVMLITVFAFVGCNKTTPDIAPEQENVNATESNSGEFVISGTKSTGIKLMKAQVMAADFEDYGISALAESAYTLTATIEPESAVNQKVEWTMAFNSPNTWAQGKNVTDYVTLTKSADTKTATLSCKAPFGCQITVTATSDANSAATASCTLDYAQKVTAASLNFGNVNVNLGGDTMVKYEVAAGVQGMGGMVNANVTTSSVYSIADNFTKTVTLQQKTVDGKFFALKGSSITGVQDGDGANMIGKQIYYDYDHDISKWFIVQRTNDILFKNLSTSKIIEYFGEITQPMLYEVTYTVTGTYSTYTYTSQIKCNGYTNNTPVRALSLNEAKFVF